MEGALAIKKVKLKSSYRIRTVKKRQLKTIFAQIIKIKKGRHGGPTVHHARIKCTF